MKQDLKLDIVIEIPKGCDRRIHLNYAKTKFEDFGPTKKVIPINEGRMPAHYGFIENTTNPVEKDELDILLLSKRKTKVAQKLTAKPIAMLTRADGDDKVVAVDLSENKMKKWSDIPLHHRKLLLAYFGHKHKIIKISGKEETIRYIDQNETKNKQ